MTAPKTPFDPILMDIPMPIVTPRLLIRPPMAGDGAMVSAAKAESWNELKAWMPWAQGDGPVEAEDEAMCRRKAADFAMRADMQLHAHDRQTGAFIGGTGFHRYCWTARRFEIGYFIRSGRAKQGYATEMACAMAHFGFAVLGANRLEIKMDTRNTASENVARRAGFKHESRAHFDAAGVDGTLRDTHVYVAFNRAELPPLDIRWGP